MTELRNQLADMRVENTVKDKDLMDAKNIIQEKEDEIALLKRKETELRKA
jgi:hypothetical protein